MSSLHSVPDAQHAEGLKRILEDLLGALDSSDKDSAEHQLSQLVKFGDVSVLSPRILRELEDLGVNYRRLMGMRNSS